MSYNSRCETCCKCFFNYSTLVIITSIIVGSIGAAYYVSEKRDESVYKPTMCFVKNYTLIKKTCASQNCEQTEFGQECTTTYYSCDETWYTVVYNVSDGREIQSSGFWTNGPGANSVSIQMELETMK
jgi:hypothetical protein